MSSNTSQNAGNNNATISTPNTAATVSGNSGNTSPQRKSLSEEELRQNEKQNARKRADVVRRFDTTPADAPSKLLFQEISEKHARAADLAAQRKLEAAEERRKAAEMKKEAVKAKQELFKKNRLLQRQERPFQRSGQKQAMNVPYLTQEEEDARNARVDPVIAEKEKKRQANKAKKLAREQKKEEATKKKSTSPSATTSTFPAVEASGQLDTLQPAPDAVANEFRHIVTKVLSLPQKYRFKRCLGEISPAHRTNDFDPDLKKMKINIQHTMLEHIRDVLAGKEPAMPNKQPPSKPQKSSSSVTAQPVTDNAINRRAPDRAAKATPSTNRGLNENGKRSRDDDDELPTYEDSKVDKRKIPRNNEPTSTTEKQQEAVTPSRQPVSPPPQAENNTGGSGAESSNKKPAEKPASKRKAPDSHPQESSSKRTRVTSNDSDTGDHEPSSTGKPVAEESVPKATPIPSEHSTTKSSTNKNVLKDKTNLPQQKSASGVQGRKRSRSVAEADDESSESQDNQQRAKKVKTVAPEDDGEPSKTSNEEENEVARSTINTDATQSSSPNEVSTQPPRQKIKGVRGVAQSVNGKPKTGVRNAAKKPAKSTQSLRQTVKPFIAGTR